MLKLAVLVSGGGTNLQSIIDSIADGRITNAEIKVVISNNKNAYALERAAKAGIPAKALSPKDFTDREAFNDALLLLALIGRQVYRRRQLLKKLQEMEQLSPKEGVAAWYGYAVCLMQHGGTAEEKENREMRALSDEAMFSSHPMTEEQKGQEMKFAEQVRENCMAKWNLIERLKYRWILCICR